MDAFDSGGLGGWYWDNGGGGLREGESVVVVQVVASGSRG